MPILIDVVASAMRLAPGGFHDGNWHHFPVYDQLGVVNAEIALRP